MTDAIASYISVLNPDGNILYASTVRDYTGPHFDDVQREDQRARVFHPEDWKAAARSARRGWARG